MIAIINDVLFSGNGFPGRHAIFNGIEHGPVSFGRKDFISTPFAFGVGGQFSPKEILIGIRGIRK
jgi:hypothetical protein